MAEKYRISVIMGIYNCAPTLADALDSLLEQTYQSFKVIMCDDGSIDNTLEVAQQYVDQHTGKFILIKNKRNMGLNYTLNHCLEYADTEYTARMDGDDLSLPHRFEQEIKFLDEHPEYAIVSGPMIHFDENGDFRISKGYGEVRKEDFINGSPFCHAACMVRTTAYNAVNGYSVDNKLLRVEDYHLWIKMYAAGYRGYNLTEPIYKMRDDRNAIARRTLSNRINEFRVRNFAVSELHLPTYKRIYSLRPLALAILPNFVYKYLHKKNTKS
jgi:glycosyltransferase EpsE